MGHHHFLPYSHSANYVVGVPDIGDVSPDRFSHNRNVKGEKGGSSKYIFDSEKCMFITTKNLQAHKITNKGQLKVKALPQEP